MISDDLIIACGSSSMTNKRCLFIKEIAGPVTQELDEKKDVNYSRHPNPDADIPWLAPQEL